MREAGPKDKMSLPGQTAESAEEQDANHAEAMDAEAAAEHKKKAAGEAHDAKKRKGMFLNAQEMKEEIKREMNKPAYDVTKLYWDRGIWQKIARAKWFENMTLSIILFNAIWIGVDTDLNRADVLLTAEPHFQIAEHAFCVYFSFEWYVRFMSFKVKRQGFTDSWFAFDSSLVAMMFLETWVMTAVMLAAGGGEGAGLGDASILRMARLLRLSRMARMARLFRAMPELLILIKGIVAAMRSVLITLFLLFILMYVFGIAFTQLMAGKPEVELLFGTVVRSMHTLLLNGTLLDGVGDVVKALGNESWIFVVVFYIFVLLSALTVMNMLIGVLCEIVSNVADTENEKLSIQFVQTKIREALASGREDGNIDSDSNGDVSVTKDQFASLLRENKKARSALEEVGVDVFVLVDNIDTIFAPEERDDDDDDAEPVEKKLGFDEFVNIIYSLRGSNTATVKDIVDLRKGIASMEKRIKEDLRRGPGKKMTVKLKGPDATSDDAGSPCSPGGPDVRGMRPNMMTASKSSPALGSSQLEVCTCGASYTVGANFCSSCGVKVSKVRSRPGTAMTPGGVLSERRRLLVRALVEAQAQLHRFLEAMPPKCMWKQLGFGQEPCDLNPEITRPAWPRPMESLDASIAQLDLYHLDDFHQHMCKLQEHVGSGLDRLKDAKGWLPSAASRCETANDARAMSSLSRPGAVAAGDAGAGPAPMPTRSDTRRPSDRTESEEWETFYISTGCLPEHGNWAKIFRLAQREDNEEIANEAERRILQELSPDTAVAYASILYWDAAKGDAKAQGLLDKVYMKLTSDPHLIKGMMEKAIRDGAIGR